MLAPIRPLRSLELTVSTAQVISYYNTSAAQQTVCASSAFFFQGGLRQGEPASDAACTTAPNAIQRHALQAPLAALPVRTHHHTQASRLCTQIIPIESLIGSSGTHCLLGMLSQLEEGRIFLEDVNSRVELDLSECQSHNGLFTEGCIVLVEGEMADDRFQVHVRSCEGERELDGG